MLILSTLWWLSFLTVVGLCVGSFLNVVIFRLPREQSLRDPLWSFCPFCHHRIAWYDNLPLLSFLHLRGRCRTCRAAIPTRYPAVEAAMALVLLLLVDAFFIARVRPGLSAGTFGLTDQLALDWPMLVGHIILFACLLSMSAIDLEYYWVDIRFTNFATIAGFALHAIWTPRHSSAWLRPFDTTAVMSVLAVVGLGVFWLLFLLQPCAEDEEAEESDEACESPPHVAEQATSPSELPSPLDPSRVVAWLTGLLLAGLFVWLFVVEVRGGGGWHWLRAIIPLVFGFWLIVRESSVVRDSDQEIVEAIEQERHTARATALWELCHLLPAIVGAGFGYWLMQDAGWAARIHDALHGQMYVGGVAMMRHWEPLYGISTAAAGYVIAGAMGWAVRIVFTLVLGKEAFGTGDIHMMAAAGCIAGWPVVALGFFLTCGVSVAGWLISMKFRRTRALPLGPWLSLSLLAVVIFLGPILKTDLVSRFASAARLLFF